jgi:hypothetical protein
MTWLPQSLRGWAEFLATGVILIGAMVTAVRWATRESHRDMEHDIRMLIRLECTANPRSAFQAGLDCPVGR